MTALIWLAYIVGGFLALIGLWVMIYVFATWKEFARDIEDGSP